MKKININSTIYVKFTELGYLRLAQLHNLISKYSTAIEDRLPSYYSELAEKHNGYIPLSLWEFMEMFGEVTYLGNPDYYSTEILIEEKDIKNLI